MPDPKRRITARRNDAPPGGDVNPEHCPELTQEVKHADIPVLAQQVAAEALQDNIPVLEETFTMFEKTIPVLDEEAVPVGLTVDVAGKAE